MARGASCSSPPFLAVRPKNQLEAARLEEMDEEAEEEESEADAGTSVSEVAEAEVAR